MMDFFEQHRLFRQRRLQFIHGPAQRLFGYAPEEVLGRNIKVTLDDRFHIGSDTKAMTATLAGMLVEEGKLRWDSTIGEVLGKELSDPSFFPVYERIEASGLPLFLHPVFVIGHQRLAAHYLTNLLGNPFETAIAAAYLVFGGVLDRFPRLDVVLPHAGGAFPWLVGRLNRGWEKRADLKHIAHPPLEYLRRFHYDTIGYSDAVLEFLVRHVGADRVVMGSDYCFPIAYEQPVTNVTGNSLIDEAAKALIVEGNARRLLRL